MDAPPAQGPTLTLTPPRETAVGASEIEPDTPANTWRPAAGMPAPARTTTVARPNPTAGAFSANDYFARRLPDFS